MIAVVPTPAALRSTIRARQTCFCGVLRSATTASSRRRSSAVDPAAATVALRRFAKRRRAPEIQLASLGVFPGPPSVLFAAPVVTVELLALHRDYHQTSWASGPRCWAHYLPGSWVPHVTLGEGIRPLAVQTAMLDAIAAWRPRPAVLHRLSLVRFHPVEPLWSTKLAPADP